MLLYKASQCVKEPEVIHSEIHVSNTKLWQTELYFCSTQASYFQLLDVRQSNYV